jgi:hypothetical protein
MEIVVHSLKGHNPMEESKGSYSTLARVLYIFHFIFLQAAFSAAASTVNRLLLAIAGGGLGRTGLAATPVPAELNRLKFPSLAGPHTEESHHSCTSELKTPPK